MLYLAPLLHFLQTPGPDPIFWRPKTWSEKTSSLLEKQKGTYESEVERYKNLFDEMKRRINEDHEGISNEVSAENRDEIMDESRDEKEQGNDESKQDGMEEDKMEEENRMEEEREETRMEVEVV